MGGIGEEVIVGGIGVGVGVGEGAQPLDKMVITINAMELI